MALSIQPRKSLVALLFAVTMPVALVGTAAAQVDTDGDGLTDAEEATLGTDPENPDTDQDTLSDGDEVHIHGTDPLLWDTDGGGLPDDDELLPEYGSDPLDPTDDDDFDSDGDGLSDAVEISELCTSNFHPDSDSDGLSDKVEVDGGTNPCDADTDEDGVSDGVEIKGGTDPTDGDDDAAALLTTCGGDELPWALGERPLDDAVIRLYSAAFGRAPDSGGLDYWKGVAARGQSLIDLANGFMGSDEWAGLYGASPTNAELVDGLYQNILGRPAEKDGRDYWIGLLDTGTPRSNIVVAISESAENISKTGTTQPQSADQGQICRLYLAVFGRSPDSDGFGYWLSVQAASGPLSVSNAMLTSEEWANLVGPDPDNGKLIDVVYANLLGRAADESGRTFWLGQLDGGLSQGAFVLEVSNSEEFVRRTGTIRS